jgi:hypothetical protein
MTAASMMMIGVLIGLIAITLIKLYPAYYDDFAVKSALQGVAEDPKASKMSPKEIRNAIARRLDVNRIDSVKEENIEISKDEGKVTVAINYEVRISMYGNLDAVATFAHSTEIKQQ